MRLDLTSLRLFVAIAECGSLTRAAQRQHLAVSAVSKRVAELESQAGTALLVRYTRGIGLTPAGQSVLQHARQMLQVMQHLDDELGEYAAGVKGQVRVQAIASALTQFLPGEIESFLTRYPQVEVALEERTGKAIVRAIAESAADVGIVAAGTVLQGLVGMAYRVDRLALGVPPGHPLARRRGVRFADALDHPFVGPHADSSLSVLMADAARACGKTLRQRIQVSSFDAMCRLVETRLGITMLPAGVLQRHAAAGRLRIVALKDDWADRELRIVVRDPQQLSALTRTLIEHLQRCATQCNEAK